MLCTGTQDQASEVQDGAPISKHPRKLCNHNTVISLYLSIVILTFNSGKQEHSGLVDTVISKLIDYISEYSITRVFYCEESRVRRQE